MKNAQKGATVFCEIQLITERGSKLPLLSLLPFEKTDHCLTIKNFPPLVVLVPLPQVPSMKVILGSIVAEVE